MAAEVVWLIDSLRLGGAERLALSYLADHHGTEWRARLVVLRGAGREPSFEAEARAHALNWWCAGARHLRDYAAWRRLKRYVRGCQPALLHVHLGYATLWGAALACALGLPWVATLHVLPGQATQRRARLLERLEVRALNSGALRIFALSAEQRRRWMTAGLRGDRVVLLPNGVAPPPRLSPGERAHFRRRWAIAETATVFLTVAAVRAGKGWREWLALIPALAQCVPGAIFVWVGDGPEGAELRAAARGQPNVRLPGHSAEIGGWLASADVFLFPSEFEAWPTALMEAMAAALPIVAHDIEANREVLGDAGRLVARGDLVAFARAAVQAALSPALARRLGAAARERHAARHSAERWRQRLEEHYREVVAVAAGGRG